MHRGLAWSFVSFRGPDISEPHTLLQDVLTVKDTQEAEGPPPDPGAKLGVTGQAFVKQLSMRLRATVGLPPMKPVPPSEAAQLELGPNPALTQAQHAIQHPEHVASG